MLLTQVLNEFIKKNFLLVLFFVFSCLMNIFEDMADESEERFFCWNKKRHETSFHKFIQEIVLASLYACGVTKRRVSS